jgi:glycine/D-amino acid oxidase-like deaminating enzyme
MERLRNLIPDAALEWASVSLAQRPVPQDGLPVIGACGPDGLFTSVMHSGITLAPLAAEILSKEVLDQSLTNSQVDLIAPYRPDRFQS